MIECPCFRSHSCQFTHEQSSARCQVFGPDCSCLYECLFVSSPATLLFILSLLLHLVMVEAQVCLFRLYKYLDFCNRHPAFRCKGCTLAILLVELCPACLLNAHMPPCMKKRCLYSVMVFSLYRFVPG